MADILSLEAFINGLKRTVDISSNTLVVDNLKIKMGSGDNTKHATFSGTLTAARTISMPDTNVSLGDIATALSTANAALPSASFTDAAVSGKLLTGYSSSAGTLAATDSILVGFNKLNGNAANIKSTADAALPSASFTDAAVTGKLITGFSTGAGVVAATDTLLQAINKLDGNANAAKSVADAALPASSFSDANVTAKVLGAGYLSAAGVVAIGDSIEVAVEKLDGNTAAVANDVGNLVTLSGVAVDSTHLGAFSPGTVIPDNSTIKAALSALDNQLSLQAAGLVYMGTIAGNYDFTAGGPQSKGWFYKISSAGTLITNTGVPAVAVNIGDMIIINDSVAQGAIVDGNLDKIDNTEAADILRTGALTSGQIFVGSAGNAATAVSMSGEASIIASGAVTLSNSAVIGKVLTGYTAGAGVITASDSILAGIQKADGNAAAAKSVADAALPSASFTDAAVTGKLITGFSTGAGVVAATDTVLQAINKLDGNANAAASAASAAQNDADNLVTLSGVAVDSTHLGTFTGSTIADNSTVKSALQALETKVELNPLERDYVAGFTVPANSSVVVRLAISGENAGRIYPCINDAGAIGSPTGKIYAIGIAQNRTGSAITAGNPCPVLLPGAIATLQSADVAFTASQDEGAPLYCSAASGAFQLAVPSAANSAVIIVGIVKDVGVSSSFQVGNMQIMGVN